MRIANCKMQIANWKRAGARRELVRRQEEKEPPVAVRCTGGQGLIYLVGVFLFRGSAARIGRPTSAGSRFEAWIIGGKRRSGEILPFAVELGFRLLFRLWSLRVHRTAPLQEVHFGIGNPLPVAEQFYQINPWLWKRAVLHRVGQLHKFVPMREV